MLEVPSNPPNPPAFPTSIVETTPFGGLDPKCGMTLRDYFAGQLLAQVDVKLGVDGSMALTRAQAIYRMADAMLVARSGKKE